MSRYTKEHYEDVALVLSEKRIYFSHLYNDSQAIVAEQVVDRIAHSLADLFATDNPDYCGYCGVPSDTVTSLCPERATMKLNHAFIGGFDREQFLAACGLEAGT